MLKAVMATAQMTLYIDAAKDLEGNISLMNSDADKGITTIRSRDVVARLLCCLKSCAHIQERTRTHARKSR
jgi:hypothetical protein